MSLPLCCLHKAVRNNNTRTSAISFAQVFSILADTSSGPPAVLVLILFSNLMTPFLVIIRSSGMTSTGWLRLVGTDPSSSKKTLVNCSLRILAISAFFSLVLRQNHLTI